ncbi:hypothetical protein ACJX0J_015953, partial [Zea mays]
MCGDKCYIILGFFSTAFIFQSICEGIWDQHYLSCTLGKNNLMSLLFTFFLTGAPYTIIHELDQNKKDHGYVCSKEENYRDAHRHNGLDGIHITLLFFVVCARPESEIFLPFICCPQVLCCLVVMYPSSLLYFKNTTPVRTGKNMVMHNHELLEKL